MLPRSACRASLSAALLCLSACVCAQGAGAPAVESPVRWGWQVKRQNTDRGEPGESTKTTLRIEHYPQAGVALLRFDLPLPDEQSDFSGSPLHPRLGDIKFRVVGHDLHWGSVPWAPRAELTLPTASPESLGAGKVQLMVGARTAARLAQSADGVHRWSGGLLIQQANSVAGDAAAKDINNTKVELELIYAWQKDYVVKVTAKPVVDWVMNGQSGAVIEWEGGVNFAGGWHATLMLGARAWGEAVAGTYGKRFELTLGRRF